MSTSIEIDRIATALLDIKASEEAIRQHRIKLEEELLALVLVKEEGAATTKTDLFRVTTTGKLSRKVDWKLFEQVSHQIPENLRPVKMRPELDITGLRWLENNEPAMYAIAVRCITTTPNKTAVAVERLPE